MSGETASSETVGDQGGSNVSFFSNSAVAWTLGRNIAAFLLLYFAIALTLLFVPSLESLLGIGSELAEAGQFLPAALISLINWTQLFFLLFLVFFWFAIGPFLGALLGVSAATKEGDSPGWHLAVASGIGGYLGYFIPMVITLIALSVVGSGSIVPAIVSSILISIPTAIAAAGMAFLSA
jgi:hypothetical protein